MKKTAFFIIFELFIASAAFGQVEYLVHDRGMLHQSIFNQGSTGAILIASSSFRINQPSFEWPPFSKTIIDGQVYDGQHNSAGSGLWIAATMANGERRIAPGGAAAHGGTTLPVISNGWIAPIELSEHTNYPVLEDGSLNKNFNPNEAEQIIVSRWATWVGIDVRRVSRQWSYPDYNDMVIYELTFTNTGNTDSNPETRELEPQTLTDVMVFFKEIITPSMLGYWRHYNRLWTNRWSGAGRKGDVMYYFDRDYWLAFTLDNYTRGDKLLAGKPEPNPRHFYEWARTGHNGGGMLSPQAPGYCILYYDYDHLATVNPDSSKFPNVPNESALYNQLYQYVDANGDTVYLELDENHKIKQPWKLWNHDDNVSAPDKWYTGWMDALQLKKKHLCEVMTPDDPSLPLRHPELWIGRPVVRANQEQRNPITVGMVFGPYTLAPGDSFKICYAEVIGYGGAAGKIINGGKIDKSNNPIPTMDRKLKSAETGEIYTEHYLTDFGYPDVVDSKVINVEQVAHKAWEAYLGHPVPFDSTYSGPAAGSLLWPGEEMGEPSSGRYTIPIPIPAPAIQVDVNQEAKVEVSWGRQVEDFENLPQVKDRITGLLAGFKVYRSVDRQGWDLVKTVQRGDVGNDDRYHVVDSDTLVKVGNTLYYAVTSVDEHGNESGKTNITKIDIRIPAVPIEKFGKVYVTPNPFFLTSGFSGPGDVDNKIAFYGLPKVATIRIYSMAGQLVNVIHHKSNSYTNIPEYYSITRNNQRIAAGIYFFVVTTPEGKTSKGKFIVIR